MKVFVVTVTYGNRFIFLQQVIDSSLQEGVKKIIVVDNNSNSESREKLREYEKKLGFDKIKVLYLDDNYGSAFGYKKGLEMAYKDPNCDFIWLLDDDNVPEKNSLKILLKEWNDNTMLNKETNIVLCSFRDEVGYDFKTLKDRNKNIRPRSVNSFLGFNLKCLPFKLFKLLIKILNFTYFTKFQTREIKKNNIVVLDMVGYGGLFINKRILDEIKYPSESFFVYIDDLEWTYRITKKGGLIFLVFLSKVKDIEKSWNVGKISIFHAIKYGSPFRIYYTVRNRVFFEKNNLVDNYFIYSLNRAIFTIILKIFVDRSTYNIFLKAVSDGFENKLNKKMRNLF